MEKRKIKLTDLVQNTGQIEGLPSNPRQWTKVDIDLLAKSIEETPELLEARGVLVYPYDGAYVIIGGNMRYSAVKELGWEEVNCEVLPADLPVEKLKAMVIKDNGSFGAWDYDSLANAWDDLPLVEWGVPAWGMGGEELDLDLKKETLADKAKDDLGLFQLTFQFSKEVEDEVKSHLDSVGKDVFTAEIVELCQRAEVK